MGIVERVERVTPFFLKQRLDRQLSRLEELIDVAVERGMAPFTQRDFEEIQQKWEEIDSPEQKQGGGTALSELERATDEELDKIFKELPLSLLTSFARNWQYNLQKHRNSLG